MKIKFLFSILLINTLLLSYDETSIIDETHDDISKKVILTSQYIDDTMYGLFNDTNITEPNILKQDIENIDFFYTNEKFIDETDKSFVRTRLQSNYQKFGDENYDIKLRAYLSLSKTRKNFRLFIEDINQDNYKELPFNDTNNNDSAVAIGISYFTLSYYDIDSKYSLGIRGTSPYIKVRYKKTFPYNGWLIEPSQSFTYSTETNFKEETKLYFDKKLDKSNLFRIELGRNTQSKEDGMEYYLAFEYFYKLNQDTGINVTQSFLGNTKFNYTNNMETTTYSTINTYNTEISWRQSIWKKWFFYEIKPGIDFQKVNNFKINYKVLFLTDFYFGYN